MTIGNLLRGSRLLCETSLVSEVSLHYKDLSHKCVNDYTPAIVYRALSKRFLIAPLSWRVIFINFNHKEVCLLSSSYVVDALIQAYLLHSKYLSDYCKTSLKDNDHQLGVSSTLVYRLSLVGIHTSLKINCVWSNYASYMIPKPY